jgi:hypothetical protein
MMAAKSIEPTSRRQTMSATKTSKTKSAKKKQTKSAKDESKLSALDAAAKVLSSSSEPMNCKELIDAMTSKGLWTTPGGKTPHATLYSAIIREITVKGKDSRFKKTERGKFTIKS